jgi:hypothetical protein
MKAAVHYIFLVGIPVIIVFILLRFGENTLTAPVHIGGIWLLESPLQTAKSSCEDLNLDYEDPTLNISQSGPHIVLFFNDENQTALKGTLTGQTILTHPSNEANKPDISLSLTINSEAEPDKLDGTLVITACEETWSFTATRQPDLDTASAGGH